MNGTIFDATSAILLKPPKITNDTIKAITIPIVRFKLNDCSISNDFAK